MFMFTNQEGIHQRNLAQVNGLLSDYSLAKTSKIANSKENTRDTALNSGTDSDLKCYSNRNAIANGPKFIQQSVAEHLRNQKD